ncbi:MAG TPA: DUF2946 domain-containing protein [Ramlibacter sp.]|nr:DUF2946 domain-containing protein [Ramlibacter sp.]
MFTRSIVSLRRICRLALLAMLALAVLPTVSHALAASGGPIGWAEICTPQGARLVAVDASEGTPSVPADVAAHLEHCPFCVPAFGALGLPPASALALGLALTSAEPPPLFLHAPRAPHAWRSAQPRAPPLHA